MFAKSTEYALRAIIYLAQKSSADHKISIAELSEATGSPKSFTAKILQKLTKGNNLVSSVTGPTGGFYLKEASKGKSIYHVLTLLGEDFTITGCILGLKECSEVNPCPMHTQYRKIRLQLLEMLDHKTIQEVANEMKDPKVVIQNMVRTVKR
jgi:Rrf2 family transcriptional regulator, iron-sulfur cluster assembly transcription factor